MPSPHVAQYLVGDLRIQIAGHGGVINIGQMSGDVASCHALRVKADDRLVETDMSGGITAGIFKVADGCSKYSFINVILIPPRTNAGNVTPRHLHKIPDRPQTPARG